MINEKLFNRFEDLYKRVYAFDSGIHVEENTTKYERCRVALELLRLENEVEEIIYNRQIRPSLFSHDSRENQNPGFVIHSQRAGDRGYEFTISDWEGKSFYLINMIKGSSESWLEVENRAKKLEELLTRGKNVNIYK
jgi:hypothetical protein